MSRPDSSFLTALKLLTGSAVLLHSVKGAEEISAGLAQVVQNLAANLSSEERKALIECAETMTRGARLIVSLEQHERPDPGSLN